MQPVSIAPPPLQPIAIVHHAGPTKVTIADFNMPFLSMVGFMVKLSIAAIPAAIIITIIAAIFWGAVIGGTNALFG